MAPNVLTWTPDIAVGVEVIDAQHQSLFSLYNRLASALEAQISVEELELAMLSLQDYVIEHFAEEQELMAESRYPDFNKHAIQHDRFIVDFLKLKRRLTAEGASRQIAEELKERVGNWLLSHISVVDRQFATFYRAQRGAE